MIYFLNKRFDKQYDIIFVNVLQIVNFVNCLEVI